MRWLYSLGIVYICSTGVLVGQVRRDSVSTETARHSISLHLGTMGAGAFYNRILTSSSRLTLQVGGRYAAYRQAVRMATAPDSYIVVIPDLMVGMGQANLKWHPWQGRTAYAVLGMAYVWRPALRFTIRAEDKLNLGGLELTPEDVGTVNLGLRWQSVVGYLGWGFGRTIPRRRIGVGVSTLR